MPILTFQVTEEEAYLLDRIMEVSFSRSRSEVIRDALMDMGGRFSQLDRERADAIHARRYYLPRRRPQPKAGGEPQPSRKG